MEANEHFWMHCLGIVVFGILNYYFVIIETDNINDYYVKLLGSFILVYPDIDVLLSNLKLKFFKWQWRLNLIAHRSIWTHSVLYPLFVYWILKDFVNYSSDMEALALIVFFPAIIHLIADLKPRAIIKTLIDDEMEKKRKKGKYSEGSTAVGGTWQYSLLPFTDNRLNYKATACVMIGNIVGMIICVIIL